MSPSPKAALYSTTLDSARRAALWTAPHPATKDGHVATGGAATMDWKELLRKFGKHNPGREGEFYCTLLSCASGTGAGLDWKGTAGFEHGASRVWASAALSC